MKAKRKRRNCFYEQDQESLGSPDLFTKPGFNRSYVSHSSYGSSSGFVEIRVSCTAYGDRGNNAVPDDLAVHARGGYGVAEKESYFLRYIDSLHKERFEHANF